MVFVLSMTHSTWPAVSAALKNGNCTFGIISLSDEGLADSAAQYQHPNLRFVMRNYYHPRLQDVPGNVYTFGLGYKRGFWDGYNGKAPGLRTVAERRYVWSFAGTMHHAERRAVLARFKQLTPNRVVETSGFGAKDGVDTRGYRDLLLDTIFVLCPYGNVNLDTFRLYEAMEAGAIPVTLKQNTLLLDKFQTHGNYWMHVFTPNRHMHTAPFIAVDTWEDAHYHLGRLLNSTTELERLRQKVYMFWRHHKWQTAMHLSSEVAAMSSPV
jgi:hypothetical protein